MKEKILKTIDTLKTEYNNGGYTNEEYHNLLSALNDTVYNMDKFLLTDDVIPSEIQDLIHKEQDGIVW